MNDHTSGTTSEPWEGEMSSELDRRVRDLHGAPLTLDQVKSKAINIQRTRRAAAAGGILAAAAVVVPVAILATHASGDAAPRPIQPATTATAATESPSQAPTEPAPATAVPSYVEGASYHRADGSVYELPSATYEFAATLGNRVVASQRDDSGTISVDVIQDDAVLDTYLAGSDLAVSETGETVAFVTSRGQVQTIWADGEAVLADGYAGWSVRAVTGGPDCLDPEGGYTGCRVLLRDDSLSEKPRAVDSHGIVEPPVADAKDIRDASGDGLLSVTNKISDAGSCGGVYDETAGRYVFKTCDYTVQEFSPDGSLVTGLPAYLDGPGGFTALLDATTGDEVARLDVTDSFVVTTTWLDDRTIAAQVFNYVDQTSSIITLTVGGDEPVTVLGPTPGDDPDGPFRLVG